MVLKCLFPLLSVLVEHCMVPTANISDNVVEDETKLRNTKHHLEHCNLVEGRVGDHYSKVYGINYRSCLMDIPSFSLFDSRMPHDIMHDVFEGVVPVEVKLMLDRFFSLGYFTYKFYCQELVSFKYGYSDTNIPVPVTKKTYATCDKIRLSSSQAMLLIRILPFLIAEKVPENDDGWQCFLLLCQICQILLSPRILGFLCANLVQLIKQHHSNFLALYGSKHYTAKFHYLVHYPRQILAIGPMVRTWTMRYEAKLNFFKQCSHLANFKNIALSLANRHQRWMCYEMSSEQVLSSKLECGPLSSVTYLRDESQETQDAIRKIFSTTDISPDITLTRPNWIKYFGTLYKNSNAFVIIGSDGLDPLFAKIMSFIVVGSDFAVLEVNLCKTLYFDSHFSSYVIDYTSNRDLVALNKLYDHYVYHGYELADNSKHISLRYYFM